MQAEQGVRVGVRGQNEWKKGKMSKSEAEEGEQNVIWQWVDCGGRHNVQPLLYLLALRGSHPESCRPLKEQVRAERMLCVFIWTGSYHNNHNIYNEETRWGRVLKQLSTSALCELRLFFHHWGQEETAWAKYYQ